MSVIPQQLAHVIKSENTHPISPKNPEDRAPHSLVPKMILRYTIPVSKSGKRSIAHQERKVSKYA